MLIGRRKSTAIASAECAGAASFAAMTLRFCRKLFSFFGILAQLSVGLSRLDEHAQHSSSLQRLTRGYSYQYSRECRSCTLQQAPK